MNWWVITLEDDCCGPFDRKRECENYRPDCITVDHPRRVCPGLYETGRCFVGHEDVLREDGFEIPSEPEWVRSGNTWERVS